MNRSHRIVSHDLLLSVVRDMRAPARASTPIRSDVLNSALAAHSCQASAWGQLALPPGHRKTRCAYLCPDGGAVRGGLR